MIGSSIISYSAILTNTNTTTLLGGAANQLVVLNIKYGHRILDILKVTTGRNQSIKQMKTNLVSVSGLVMGNAGYNGEYPFPTDLLRPTRVEVSFDGVNWKKCDVYDNSENDSSEFKDSQINDSFDVDQPQVDFTRDSFKIRPLKLTTGDITDGIYIEFEKRQADLTVGTAPDFEANLHDILAFDIAADEILMHSENYDNAFKVQFANERALAEARFLEFYKNRFKRSLKLNPIIDDFE